MELIQAGDIPEWTRLFECPINFTPPDAVAACVAFPQSAHALVVWTPWERTTLPSSPFFPGQILLPVS
ncbi:hypothetical protein THTE_1150 [Thermogutta terrifontis]|uniref:Uncharacterized protein n=1 Tax=Thermogutta terrifontis TaxID=1331910 RepID=A0A286RCR0_9BACT|nr:hypothetical protein THTE_1150 [Thermogutta terrifontis]